MVRARMVGWLVLAASAASAAGCGGEDLDTGPAVPPTTAVVTTTAAATGETATGEEAAGDAEAGREVFATAGCAGCHTLAAAGSDGTVGPNLDETKPTFDTVLTTVTNGRGAMPAFEDQLSETAIRDVAAFVSESAGAS